MKKPIDPNLEYGGEEELLQNLNLDDDGSSDGFSLIEKRNGESLMDDTVSVQEIMDEIEIPAIKTGKSKGKLSNKTPSSSSHHHHHHHHHHRRSSKKKKKEKLPVAAKVAIGILAFIFGALIIAGGAFLVMKGMGYLDLMKKGDADSEQISYQETIEYKGHTYKYNDDVFSLAFFGIDQRTMKNVKQTDFVGAADADVVISINTKTGETKVIAIPRDTMVDVDIWSTSGIFLRTEKTQLCLAYAYGDGKRKSCENAVNAVSRILYNIPIQKYYALDLDGIAPLNDSIGGVTVTSKYALPQYNIKVGDEVTLKGDMAEAYVRTRDMDDINASLNRTERQVQYINAFADQALPAVVRDFSTVSKLYNTGSKYSQTNLSLNNATYIGSLLLSKGITDFETYSLKGEMKASEDSLMPDVVHAEFYPDEDNLMETVLDVFYTQID